jgi:hypothetical protein
MELHRAYFLTLCSLFWFYKSKSKFSNGIFILLNTYLVFVLAALGLDLGFTLTFYLEYYQSGKISIFVNEKFCFLGDYIVFF